MFKKASIRRIAVATAALVIFGIIYFFPHDKKDPSDSFIQELVYTTEADKSSIYLIDKNDYVARANVVINSKDTKEKIKQIIETLTINSTRQNYIPNGFKPIIPEGTKLINLDIDSNGILKLNFSKELLEVSEKDEEKMLEAIIYSCTTINEVKKIMIFVDTVQLTKLPHSNKNLPLTLDRNFGINKVYDLNKYKETTKTTVYYVSNFNDNTYYVPITHVVNGEVDKIEVIINELKSSPIYQTNLMSYLATNAELLEYEVKENKIFLSFNNYLLDDFEEKKILEEVKYTIGLSLKDNFDISEIEFQINGEIVETIDLKSLV